MLPIHELRQVFAYGLKKEGADSFENPKKGLDIAEYLIENLGYVAVSGVVLETIQEDCPFLFQGD